tara:strand:+ start:83 stop:274 length:192 start_codon:yes stop_codon:yes gene_type:complete
MTLDRNDIKFILEVMNKESVRLDKRMKVMAKESDSSYEEYENTVDSLNCVKKVIEKIKKEYII